MKTWLGFNWLKLVAIALILGVLGSNYSTLYTLPYAYYQFMNWAVVGAALAVALQSFKQNKKYLTWFFVFVAVVFNPIAPIYLSQNIWQIADIVVAALFIFSFFLVRAKNNFSKA